MQEVKRALRKQLIERRNQMQPDEKQLMDESIFGQLKPLLSEADAVLTYVSTAIEVDTRKLLEYCFDNGITVATPVSGDSELFFYQIRCMEDLAVGRFGIYEPVKRVQPFVCTDRTLCIVPALCADGKGLRLGYGRGYYDRFLDGFIGKSVIVCYSSFRMEVPSEPHDKKADVTIFDK